MILYRFRGLFGSQNFALFCAYVWGVLLCDGRHSVTDLWQTGTLPTVAVSPCLCQSPQQVFFLFFKLLLSGLERVLISLGFHRFSHAFPTKIRLFGKSLRLEILRVLPALPLAAGLSVPASMHAPASGQSDGIGSSLWPGLALVRSTWSDIHCLLRYTRHALPPRLCICPQWSFGPRNAQRFLGRCCKSLGQCL